jgi:hypothetical protein
LRSEECYCAECQYFEQDFNGEDPGCKLKNVAFICGSGIQKSCDNFQYDEGLAKAMQSAYEEQLEQEEKCQD